MKNVRVIRILCLLATALAAGMGCAGSDGRNGVDSLVKLTDEPAGKNCTGGGQRIDEGDDTDGDGKLSADEIQKTTYVCSGADGTDGSNGTNGKVGSNGTDGVNGTDGLSTLVKVTFEAPGSHCPNGGQRINSGIDSNSSQTLDKAEVDSTQYFCDGGDGVDGVAALVDVKDEPVGLNCIGGGSLVRWGLDTNRDGNLQIGEVVGSKYVCNIIVGEGIVYMTDGTTRPVVFVPCGTGDPGQCVADNARGACQAIGLRVASHASDGSATVTSLGGVDSCQFSISYFISNDGMPADACLVGISNLDWSSCCGLTDWHGNTVAFGLPGDVFGYVSSSNSGYDGSYSNTSGTTWGCSAMASAASNLSGCVTQYVACTP